MANPGGPRLLTQRNLEKVVLDANGVEIPRPDVAPGNMQLFSYYKPGLTAGNYFISAEQVRLGFNSLQIFEDDNVRTLDSFGFIWIV